MPSLLPPLVGVQLPPFPDHHLGSRPAPSLPCLLLQARARSSHPPSPNILGLDPTLQLQACAPTPCIPVLGRGKEGGSFHVAVTGGGGQGWRQLQCGSGQLRPAGGHALPLVKPPPLPAPLPPSSLPHCHPLHAGYCEGGLLWPLGSLSSCQHSTMSPPVRNTVGAL